MKGPQLGKRGRRAERMMVERRAREVEREVERCSTPAAAAIRRMYSDLGSDKTLGRRGRELCEASQSR